MGRVIRSYDRALQMLKDGEVVEASLQYKTKKIGDYELSPTIFRKLFRNRVLRSREIDVGIYEYTYVGNDESSDEAAAKREAEAAAERQRREDARVKEIAAAILQGDEYGSRSAESAITRCIEKSKDKLIAILGDVVCNGI